MTENKLLIGSLSNDLSRVANLSYRGSVKAAENFWRQAQRWIGDLEKQENKPYIVKIVRTLAREKFDPADLAQAEKNLMYSVILQNYSLYLD